MFSPSANKPEFSFRVIARYSLLTRSQLTALERPRFTQTGNNGLGEIVITQPPTRCQQLIGWRLRDEAFDSNLRIETFEIPNDQLQVSIDCRQVEVRRRFYILLRQARATQYLKLVHFDHIDLQSRKKISLSQHRLFGFSGKIKNQMAADRDAEGLEPKNCLSTIRHGMTTPNPTQYFIVDRLETKLHHDKAPLAQVPEIRHPLVGKAIRPSGNNQSLDPIGRKCLFKIRTHLRYATISIRARLKISKE